MSTLLKVEPTKRFKDLEIDYLLTFKCNYDCSYCISHDVNHPTLKRNPEEIIEGVKFLISFYPDKKRKKLVLLGGEPFLYKPIAEVLNELTKLLPVNVLTNLSVSKNYLNKLDYNNNLTLSSSFHPEFSDPIKFVDKVLYLRREKGQEANCMVSIHPNEKFLKHSLYVLEKTESEYTSITYLSKMDSNLPDIFGESYAYSSKIKNAVDKYKKNLGGRHFNYIYEDSTKIIKQSDIVLNNLDNFKGMKCEAGHQKIHIDEAGHVYPAACFLNTSARLGNIFNKTFKRPSSYVSCPFTSCKCATDLLITKFRN